MPLRRLAVDCGYREIPSAASPVAMVSSHESHGPPIPWVEEDFELPGMEHINQALTSSMGLLLPVPEDDIANKGIVVEESPVAMVQSRLTRLPL